ncbi:MAG: hypothetical protein SVT56_03610 [Chloroflexota bacterium]|nr:hypothetical protein [Chloroflexota bacterium]
MNNDRRQIHELEILSAYLDNVLDPIDRKKLEERLKLEPELRERLENLRRTKITLGALPRLKAPRNFTLTPEMVTVRKPKRKPLFIYLRLAASFAAILLVVLVGFELIWGGRMGSEARLAAEAPVMEADSLAAEATPEPLILWGRLEGGGGAGSQESVTGYGGVGGVVPENEEQPKMMEEAVPMEEPVEGEEQAEEMVEDMPEDAEISKAAGEAEEVSILGLNPEEGGETLSRSEPQIKDQEITTKGWSALRWIQVSLALIALGGGALLFLMRRK